VLYTNLAAVQREQHNYSESEELLKNALMVLHEHASQRCLDYTARQYAALLQRTNRDSEAEFIAKNSNAVFAFLPAVGLKGRVEKRSAETGDRDLLEGRAASAPLLPGRAETTGVKQQLDGQAETTSEFSGQPLDGTADSPDIALAPALLAGRSTAEVQPPPHSQAGAGGPTRLKYKGEEDAGRGGITIRLTYYKVYPRNAFDALNLGLRMLRKGADVTVILDKEAVLLADRHFSDEVQVRGKGAMIRIHSVLEEFIRAGGKVLASQSWAEEIGLLQGGAMTPGITPLTDDEMADEYLSRRGSILEY